MADCSNGYQLMILPAELSSGQLALTMVVRRTWRLLAGSATLEPLPDADQPPPLVEDQFDAGDASTAPPTLEADVAPEKARVDVIVLGKAYAPGGKPVPEFECALQIGRKREVLRILGPRRALWQPLRRQDGKMLPQPPRFTDPLPVAEVPLSLRLAYGGWSWLVPDAETLRIQREVAAVMAAEAAETAPAATAAAAARGQPGAAAPRAQPETPSGGDRAAVAAESLRLGDGSEGYDAEGVRLWDHAASKDGTAVLGVDEFARRELAVQAAQRRPSPVAAAAPELRQNAAGEWLEVDEGVAILTAAALAAEAPAPSALAAAAEPMPRPEVVLNPDGARHLEESEPVADWAAALHADVATEDAKTAAARKKAAAARREAEDAALAEFPRLPCPSNPFGVGFCVSNHAKVIERTGLPQIEDPRAPLTPADFVRDYQRLDAVPLPAGFSTLPRQARPRVDLAGPLPSALADWESEQQAQKKSVDLTTRQGVQTLKALEARKQPRPVQPGFYNCALPAMQWPALQGDEEVVLENLSKNGRLFFKLPGRTPLAELERGRGVERRDLRLDTLIIDAEKGEVALVWRAQFAFAAWEELADYPQLTGHVLDWDIEDRRRRADLDAIKRARTDGTLVLGVDAAPEAAAPFAPVERPGEPAAEQALELPRMGTYVEAEDDGWAGRADEAAAAAADKRAAEQAELAWREQTRKAIAALDAEDRATAARRAQIGAAIAAGKKVPPRGSGSG